MAIDFFIHWSGDVDRSDDFMKVPTFEAIGEVMEDYFSGLYMELDELPHYQWLMKLKGTYSHMFKRHGGRDHSYCDGQERYISVYVDEGGKGMTVTVRHSDDVTLGLARDFAKRCAQRWDGTVDDPG